MTTDTVEVVIPSDDPRSTVAESLATLPIAERITAMDERAYRAMAGEMVAALDPWINDGRPRPRPPAIS